MTNRIRIALLGLSAAALTLFVVTAALAVDDAKPAPDCHGVLVEDGKSDGVDGGPPGNRTSDAAEIERTFFKYDPTKGAEATTLNMVVKNLELSPPTGATGMIWDFKFATGDGATHFVRAVLDYTGGSAFEYGTLDTSISTFPRYVPEGDTPGKFFEGPDGVIQLVVPTEWAKAGATIKSLVGEVQLTFQIVPSAIRTPTRGVGYVYDDTAGKSITIAECTPEQLNQGGGGVLGAVARSLPVTLATKATTAKKAKKSKSLSLKLKSTEKITALTAKLLKGKTTYGKGKLAEIDGSATLKLKLSKKLKKGSYTVNLAGTDSAGNKLTTTAKYKVK
jgi:hypothetical protein